MSVQTLNWSILSMIASAAADIEDERGWIDSTGSDHLVKHPVWTWVQAFIKRGKRTSFVAGPHMRINCPICAFRSGIDASPSTSSRDAPLVMRCTMAHRGLTME